MTRTKISSSKRVSPKPAKAAFAAPKPASVPAAKAALRPCSSQHALFDDRRGPLAAIRAGGMIVVVDDEERENEGNLTMAAERVTPKAINCMITHARGLLCLSMTPERLDALENPARRQRQLVAPRHADVRLNRRQVRWPTGVSAPERAATIRAAMNPATTAARPGEARSRVPDSSARGGVLAQAGHPEGAVDLTRLAGMRPAGVICTILNEDGSVARAPTRYVRPQARLPIMTIADLVRTAAERVAGTRCRGADSDCERRVPVLRLRSHLDAEHMALVKGDLAPASDVLAARALAVSDRRRVPLGALRLRRAAARRMQQIAREGPGRPALPASRGPGHRPGQQDPRLRAAGPRPDTVEANESSDSSRTSATTASAPRSCATSVSGAALADEQPAQGRWPGGLRALGGRIGAHRNRAVRAHPGLPPDQGGKTRAQAVGGLTAARTVDRARPITDTHNRFRPV